MSTQTANLTAENLAQFYGSENLYFNWLFRSIHYTDGVQFVNANGAGWLVDAVLSHCILTKKVARQPFVVATLKVKKNKSAVLTFTDGNTGRLASQKFDWTDFPLEEISFYVEWNGERKIMMLPSER